MQDVQEPREPRFDAESIVRWLIAYPLLGYLFYFNISQAISTFRDVWPQFKIMSYGFPAPTHGAILELTTIRVDVESKAATLAVALVWIWIEARWRKRADASKVARWDKSRRLGATILLAMPFVMLPGSFLLLVRTVIEFKNGMVAYPFYGGFFVSLSMCAFLFVVVSEFIYGKINTATNDELRQHFRAKAFQSGFWAMLITGGILYAAAIASPFWASMSLPLVLTAGVVVPILRFALLELFTGTS